MGAETAREHVAGVAIALWMAWWLPACGNDSFVRSPNDGGAGDAAPGDAEADATGGGSDAATSDAAEDGSAVTHVVACGGSACALPSDVCCYSNEALSCMTGDGCTVASGLIYACDDATDCASNQECCLDVGLDKRVQSVQCVPTGSCTGISRHIACRPGAGTCPAAKPICSPGDFLAPYQPNVCSS